MAETEILLARQRRKKLAQSQDLVHEAQVGQGLVQEVQGDAPDHVQGLALIHGIAADHILGLNHALDLGPDQDPEAQNAIEDLILQRVQNEMMTEVKNLHQSHKKENSHQNPKYFVQMT